MINKVSYIYSNWVLKKPKLILFILLIFLVLFSISIPNFKLDASADSLILENDKDLKTYRETLQRYQTKDFLVMTFTPIKGDVFDLTNLNILKNLKNQLLEIEGVDSVTTLVDVPLVKSSSLSFTEMISDVPTIFSQSVDRKKAKLEMLNSPIYKNLIISEDAKTSALQINIKTNPRLNELIRERAKLSEKEELKTITLDEQKILLKIRQEYELVKERNDALIHQLLNHVRDVKKSYETGYGLELRLGGVPMIADDMISYVKSDLANFGFGVFVFIVITLKLIFKRIRWIILPLLSCIYAVSIMIGLLGFFGWKVTVISSNFISLMLILTLSMNIHLIVRYRQLCAQSDNAQLDIVDEMAAKMVRPCLYTALTTIVAFASLVFSDIKPVIDFGYMMVLGLSVTFITSFLLLPSILCLLNKETNYVAENKNRFRFTQILADFTVNKGRYILITTFLVSILTLFGVTQLKVENSFINYFKSDTEIYKGMKQIDDKLGGTTPLDVVLKFEDPKETENKVIDDFGDDLLDDSGDQDPSSNWFTTDKINKIKQVHDYLDNLPEVGKVLSLASTVRVAEELNDNKELDSLEMALLYKRAPESVKNVAVNPYISIDDNEARISLRVLDSKEDLRRKELIEKIDRDLENDLGLPRESFVITGILVLYNNMLQSLFDSQILSLGFVMLGIGIMFMILFRSWILSLIGIIPNLLAAIFVLGLMGLINLPLDMMTITIAAITIGIAVDNSIHYIYRFREEFEKLKDYKKTIYVCHDSIGRAIFFTGITIIFGFSILVLSNFIPTIIFGLLTGFAMFVALIAVLTLLPKLIISFKPF
ncbi:MAG: MMPL family transporter [Pseudomonadota bacterium]|nr:MMPL family transporter [Pseudomonadota bacterium]